MMGRLLNKLLGEYRFTIDEKHYTDFLNSAIAENVIIYKERRCNERYEFYAPAKESEKILHICREHGITADVSPLLGIPGLFCKYRKRYGAFVGAAVFLITVFMSRYFIWDFKIVGNSTVPDDVILAGLEELGCTYGSFIPSMDFEMIANDFLLASDDIAWISVNMRSSLAAVEVKERQKGEPSFSVQSEDGKYANITASEDAEIVLPQIISGKSVVIPGDIVRRGDLLATGVINVREESVRYEYALGQILGKVYREIVIRIPLEAEKKVYTGRSSDDKFVKIFGKTKNLFGNSSIDYAKYDKIEEEKQLTFFGSVTVPVWFGRTVMSEYEYEPCVYSENEARSMAKIEFSEALELLLEEGEIVSIETEEAVSAEELVLTGRIYLIKDIASLSEFTVSDNSTKGVNE